MAIYRFNPGGIREPATYVLIALNSALAIADGFTGEAVSRLFWARAIDVYYGEYWRPLSAGFAHVNIMHILMNMYSLFVLGKLVEPLYGTRRFLLIYFVSLLGGSALSLTLSDPSLAMEGASGAIFGLFGALLGYLFSRTGSWAGVWSTPYGRQLIIVLGLNVFISLAPGVSLLGHLGGFVPGVMLGIYFERAAGRRESIYDVATFWLVLVCVPLLTIYSCIPLNRAGFKAVQALKAYEAGDLERGDELREEAKNAKWVSQEGTQNLLDHLASWRKFLHKEDDSLELLRWPLTHINGIPVNGPQAQQPYAFLKSPEELAHPQTGAPLPR
ncbi:Rhomboid protease GluP [Planctomycetaceae bacterium]|nr:Rhomboid protease GluP [Planctomycetaceae bacterium]